MKNYLKYYWLEKYLFEEVSQNFKRGHLTADEFFAIVIWKRNASKTKIKDSLIKNGKDIEKVTADIFKAKNDQKKQLSLLTDIDQIGISFASAILTVCYPKEFTIVDYRARASLKDFGEEISGNPTINPSSYFEYLGKCIKLADRFGLSLRDFDRILWAKDFYEGDDGLKTLVEKYKNKELEIKRVAKSKSVNKISRKRPKKDLQVE